MVTNSSPLAGRAKRKRREKAGMVNTAPHIVRGKYPPTVTELRFSGSVGVWYVFTQGEHYIYTGFREITNKAGDRLCLKFSASGNTAWAHDTNNRWVGTFNRGAEESK